jgi:hypothetical protein
VRRDDHAVGLFVIEKKADNGRWCVLSTRRTVWAAQNYAWEVLTREGGEVRVRQDARVVAKGAGCEASDVPPTA